jgi:hypothetical protein
MFEISLAWDRFGVSYAYTKAINDRSWPLVSVNDKPLRGRYAIIDPAQTPASYAE